jgi:F-type H+-transporting ATPase subunit epsilon
MDADVTGAGQTRDAASAAHGGAARMESSMRLSVLAPTRVVVNERALKVVAEAANGMFCLLPRHVDFTAALVAGILYFDDGEGRQRYVAVDEGILVKRGADVMVSCYDAIAGADLDELHQLVAARYLELDEDERVGRSALARLEAGALRGLVDLEQRGRNA